MPIIYDERESNPKLMHLQARRGEIAENVIVPGDPFRTDWIAGYFDESHLVAHSREIKIYTGSYKGVPVSVCSTGMGCPSTAIVCEELCQAGAKLLLRTGSGFLLRDGIKDGDLAVTLGSAKYEGTTEYFVPKCHPAIADIDLVTALVKTARRLSEGTPYAVHTGVTATVDGFYGETPEFLAKLKEQGIMNLEMESAAVITTAMRYGARGGCICTCGHDDSRPEAKELYLKTMERQIHVALDAIVMLNQTKESELVNLL